MKPSAPPAKVKWLPRGAMCLFVPNKLISRKEGCWFSRFDAPRLLLNALAGLHAEQGIGDHHSSIFAHGWRNTDNSQAASRAVGLLTWLYLRLGRSFQLDPKAARSVSKVHSPGGAASLIKGLLNPGQIISHRQGWFFFERQTVLRCSPTRGI